jgi:polysaccharide biosynthesis protein PslH
MLPRTAMKLLYFAAHQIWPLTSGNRLRDYHLSRQLVKRASVTFVETCHGGEQPTRRSDDCNYDRIVSLKKGPGYTPRKLLRGMKGPVPLTVLNYFEEHAASQLIDALEGEHFDIAQVEGVHLSRFLPVIRALPSPPTIVMDWHNIESELMWRYSENVQSWPRKLVARRTARLLESAELNLLETCSAHTVPSERERQKLLARCPAANVHTVPNGVDTLHFSSAEMSKVSRNAESATSRQSLLFVGSMDYQSNIDAVTWFVREIWPTIAARNSSLDFLIVGRNPSREVRQLASDRVRVTGTVEDVRPFYLSAVAVVVPLRMGSGTRLKILEAMAAGVPVISTSLGAEGIDAISSTHLLLADTGAEMVGAISEVVTSPATRSRLRRAAQSLVASHYDWTVLGEKLYGIHSQLFADSVHA